MKTRLLVDVYDSGYGFIKGRESGLTRYYEVKKSDVEIFEEEKKSR
ncbi:hypothetical protein [Cyanobacterium aponinum]|uniref:Uncharacterized protein n=1 Tax=Cyanobacterium aponinum 0216 TaxID=2676140 RepID=A0A844H1S5_9CHRO|nr:hypothetical protein [Cyanobacterium aponinum]MTF40305.1 hypothetical protein [Cyanobacterium aponinum 0216]